MLMLSKKVIYTLLFPLLLGFNPLWGQLSGEQVLFGYDDVSELEISRFETGEYLLAASSNQSVVLMFYNDCGDTLWTQEYFKGSGYDRIIRVQNDNQNIYLAAAYGDGNDTAIALLKIDKSGQLLFSKSISSPDTYRWYQFHIDEDNNLYFTGNSTSTNNNLASTILKLNDQGQIIHAFQYGSSFIWGMSVPAKNGGLLNISGTTLFKVEANGALSWVKRYDGIYQSSIAPIALNDGFIVFGNFIGAIDRNMAFKIDLQGNLLWTSDKFLNINYQSASLDPNGNILISFSLNGNNGLEWGVQKLSATGNNIGAWILPYSTGDGVSARDLRLLNTNTLLLAGITNFNFANYKAINLRYLPLNLNDLESCRATAYGLNSEASQINLAPNVSNFSPVAYNQFQVANKVFPKNSITVNENNFCQNNHADFRFSLGLDTAICSNSPIVLKADTTAPNFIYQWNTGATSSEINAEEEGLYWLEISDKCNSFVFRDSIQLSIFSESNFSTSFSPESAAPGEEIEFSATGNGQFNWYFQDQIKTGETVRFAASSAFADGIVCEFIDTNNCVQYDTLFPGIIDAEIFLPNAFSPNNDGLNDVFGLEPGVVYNYQLEIYDRYGALIADLNNQAWDGANYSGTSYIYVLRYQLGPKSESKILRGVINLIR